MADEAKLKRNSTMDLTVKEGTEFVTRQTAEADQSDSGKSPVKPTRQGTMQTTAKEGIEYLKNSRQDTLLQAQGLVPPTSTTTEADDVDDTNGTAAEETANGTPKLAKHTTMVATAEEAAGVMMSLGGSPDKDVKTRGQQKQLDKLLVNAESGNEAEPEVKRPRRENTMAQTAKEAAYVIGTEELGETRSSTHAAKKSAEHKEEVSPSPTKTRSMAETLKDSERILGSKK